MLSHSIGSLCQRLDDKPFIIRSPSPHRRTWGRVNDVPNVLGDVRFLTSFVVQGNGAKRQRLEDSSDVDLGATCGANAKFLQVKVDKFLNELEDLISRRWKPGRVWTFVEGIQDNKSRAPSQQSQHLLQAFLQSVVTGLLRAIFVCGINAVENVTAGTRGSRKLGYEGK